MSKSTRYQSYQGKTATMQYYNVIGAADNQTFLLKNYQIHKFEMIETGKTYKFTNVISKADGLWVVSSSSIGFAKDIEVNPNLQIPPLPEDLPPSGVKRSLSEALMSPQRSTITAKIVKVSPVKFRKDGKLAVRCLGLEDQSGYAKVALFSNLAENSFPEGKVLELSGVYKKEHEKKPQLAMTRASSCQFLPDGEMTVDVTSDDISYFQKDGDFAVENVEEKKKFEVDAIYEVTSYDSCTNSGCYKKKMMAGICPTCQGDKHTPTCRAKISVISQDFSKDLTFFEIDLQKLFGPFTSYDQSTLLNQFIECLPVYFQGKVYNNNIYNIERI